MPRRLPGLGRLPELVERRDAGLVVDPADGLGADAGDAASARRGRRGTSPSASPRPGSRPRRAGRRSSPGSCRRCPASPSPCPAGQARRPMRAVADDPRRLLVGEDAEAVGAVELVEGSELARRRRRSRRFASGLRLLASAVVGLSLESRGVTRVPVCAMSSATLPIRVVLPTYNEADNLEPLVAAVLAAAPEGDRHPRRRRLLPRRHRRDRRPARRRRPRGSTSCIAPRKEGLGPAYVAGFARALAGRGADRADGRRLLPRSRRRPAADRGDHGRGRRRPRARLALRRRVAAVGDWGAGRQAISRVGEHLRADLARPRRAAT